MLPKTVRSLLAPLLILGLAAAPMAGQDPKVEKKAADKAVPPAGQVSNVDKKAAAEAGRQKEKRIEERDSDTKGIDVGDPKVYDDSLLQQMLNAAEARLMSLQILDQTGISARLGAITGARQSISSFALSVAGPPLPGVTTTSNGATNSTVATNQNAATTSANPSATTTNTVQNTANAPVTNVTTTAPSVPVPTVTPPAPSTTMPSSFSVSASDLLNEQMQLTFEIANLRLLLEGSLNDRIIGGTKIVKPRVTVGFPITVLPDGRHKNAMAVVEVEIEKAPKDVLNSAEPPAIVALLPREKTYNIASITDKSVSIGGGVVTQVASVAGSFLHATKTYYVVQDQDTLALTYKPEQADRVGFLWQFRPVLGAKYVKAGLKQTFVQIAFPSDWSAPSFGTIHVRTYWRSYDQQHNVAKHIQRDSLREYATGWPILNFSLEQDPKIFNATTLEDLGNGQMLVTLGGRFLGGTYVRIGSNILRDGTTGFTSEYQQIRFVSSISDLATKQVKLVARDGKEKLLVFQKEQFEPKKPLRIKSRSLEPLDDVNTQIIVELEEIHPIHDRLPLIFVIGGKVFGYGDAPIRRDGNKLSVIVPTAFLIANPQVAVKALFTESEYWKDAQFQVSEFRAGAQAPRLSLLELGSDSAKFILYGNSLDKTDVVSPSGTAMAQLGSIPGASVRVVTLTKDQIKSYKQLVLKTQDGILFQVPIPAAEFTDAKKPVIKPVSTVTVGMDEVVFQGDGLDALQKVVFNGIELKLRKQADGKTVWVKGLKAAGVTAEAKPQTLDFVFKSGKTAVVLNVSPPKAG
jgi:hypothetical protein